MSIFLFISCGNKEKLKDEINKYVDEIKLNNNLSTSITEGKIKYGKDYKETGGFEFYEYYKKDSNHKKLFRLESISSTDILQIENFFYKNNALIYIEFINNYNKDTISENIYLNNNKIFYSNIKDQELNQRLIEKGSQFLDDFLTEIRSLYKSPQTEF